MPFPGGAAPPRPELAHLSQDMAGVIGLWRSPGCHGSLGSPWAPRKGWAVIIMP